MLKLQRYALIFFLAAFPFLYSTNGMADMRVFQEQAFQVCAMGLVGLFIGNIWLSLFMIWTLFLLVINGGQVGFEYTVNIFLALMLFKMAKSYYGRFKFTDDSKTILWLVVVNLLFVISQQCGVDPIHSARSGQGVIDQWADFRDPVGIFGVKSINGVFLAIMIPIMARINVLIAILLFIPIYLCQSTAAIFAGGMALMSYLYMTKACFPFIYWIPTFKKLELRRMDFSVSWFKLLLVPIFCLVIFYGAVKDFNMDSKMFMSRFGTWHAALKMSLARPIGYGPDAWRNLTPSKRFLFAGDQDRRTAIATNVVDDQYAFTYYDPNPLVMKQLNIQAEENKDPNFSPNFWDNAHNQYVTLLFMFGFPGLILFVGLIRDMILRFKRTEMTKELALLTSLLIAYAAASTTQFPLELARVGYLFPIVLGAWYAITERKPDAASDY